MAIPRGLVYKPEYQKVAEEKGGYTWLHDAKTVTLRNISRAKQLWKSQQTKLQKKGLPFSPEYLDVWIPAWRIVGTPEDIIYSLVKSRAPGQQFAQAEVENAIRNAVTISNYDSYVATAGASFARDAKMAEEKRSKDAKERDLKGRYSLEDLVKFAQSDYLYKAPQSKAGKGLGGRGSVRQSLADRIAAIQRENAAKPTDQKVLDVSKYSAAEPVASKTKASSGTSNRSTKRRHPNLPVVSKDAASMIAALKAAGVPQAQIDIVNDIFVKPAGAVVKPVKVGKAKPKPMKSKTPRGKTPAATSGSGGAALATPAPVPAATTFMKPASPRRVASPPRSRVSPAVAAAAAGPYQPAPMPAAASYQAAPMPAAGPMSPAASTSAPYNPAVATGGVPSF